MSNEPIEIIDHGGPSRLALMSATIVGIVLVIFIGVLATSDGQQGLGPSPLIGELTPDIIGEAVDGSTYDIQSQRGRWVVVNFFSTTCIPCIVEHPELVAFDEDHRDIGDASVVSIAFSDPSQNVIDFFAENGGDWPVLAADTGQHAISFGVAAVPETYLVAPTGIITTKFLGGITQADIEAEIARLSGAPQAGGQ